ncbi:MAG: hypothetical protein ACYDAI_06300 [Trichloromonadaceae bacterium]
MTTGLLCTMTFLGIVSGSAFAVVTGSVDLRYGEQRSRENGTTALEGSQFSQQYSLLYQTQGKVMQGRAGNYTLGLGYEWSSLDREQNGEGVDIQTGKILYRGDILVAPGGLPFRLRLYSQDMTKTYFLADSVDSLFEAGGNDFFVPGRPLTNLSNGQNIRTGITLVVGESNGRYLGLYREVLDGAPRLLVDYAENYVRDLKSLTPQHFRSRDLAFVSLNKRDNWLHYRLFEHRDFLQEQENFDEKSLLLGTIDHTSQRRWVNMTNWIQISADGSYTTGRRQRTDDSGFNRYDLNLFARARRADWQASSFNSFSRVEETGLLRRSIETPLYVQGDWGRDTSWRGRFIGQRESDLIYATGEERTEDVLYATARVETFKHQPIIVAPEVAAEVKGGSRGGGEAVRVGLEVYSNRSNRPRFDWLAGYSLAHFGGTGQTGLETDFWEQMLRGTIAIDLSSTIRTGFEQEAVFGTGSLERSTSQYIAPRSDLELSQSNAVISQRDGTVFRSVSSWFGEHRSTNRLYNRVEATYELLHTEEDDTDQVEFSHSLRYDWRNLNVDMRNRLVIGNNIRGQGDSFGGILSPTVGGGQRDKSYTHSSNLWYSPGRTMEASARLNYEWRDGVSSSSNRWRVQQDYRYNLFAVNGIVRKLADIGERFEYEVFDPTNGSRESLSAFTLLGNYYPTRHTLLGARIRYEMRSPEDTNTLTWYTTAGLDFEKFQLALDYSYGNRTAGSLMPERKEHRWEVQVKKTF